MKNGDVEEDAVLGAAAILAWNEARVSLAQEDLRRAARILEELGLRSPVDGKAKLDVKNSAEYREAEADYEECVRSCLTL